MSSIQSLFDELKQKRDELRVQVHLASKDARDEWEELEGKMKDFSRKADLARTGDGVEKALHSLGDEIRQGYRRIRHAIRDD